MTTTPHDAVQDMLARFEAVWIAGYGWKYERPNKAFNKPTSEPWARFQPRHASGQQASLVNHAGAHFHEQAGNLFIQLFFPNGEGYARCYEVADAVASAYRGKKTPGVIWYRDVALNEVDGGDQMQINVVIAFEYDINVG